MPNPIWTSIIASTLARQTRKCPHCGRNGVYAAIEPGRYRTCKHCGRRFIEKKEMQGRGKS